MRQALVAIAIAACNSHGSSSTLLENGLVIGISEGEQRAFQLARTGVKIHSAASALGATIDPNSNQLVLNVACNAVPGTTGPTREFQIELEADGAVTVVTVEVHPSGLPPCLPTVVACVHDVSPSKQGTGRLPCDKDGQAATRGGSAFDGMTADMCTANELVAGTRIQFNYLDVSNPEFSDLTQPDKALLLHLANPDDTDTGLNFALATDSPLKTPPSHDDECVSLANANVVGTFSLDWTIVRGMAPSDPFVAAGTWELAWNKRIGPQTMIERYGLEVVSCANDDTMPGCSTFRQKASPPQQPPPPTQPQWCIPANTNDSTSIEMRLWASPAPTGEDSYDIDISAQWEVAGPAINLVAGNRRGQGTPGIRVSASATSIPMEVQMDVGKGTTGDVKVTIAAHDTANGPSRDLVVHVGGTCLP